MQENPFTLILVIGVSPLENSKDDFRESVNVVKEESPGLDLDTYADAGKASLTRFQDFELISEQRIVVNSRDVQELIYSFNFNGVTIQNLIHIYYVNNTGYIVTASATSESFNTFKPLFITILETFVVF